MASLGPLSASLAGMQSDNGGTRVGFIAAGEKPAAGSAREPSAAIRAKLATATEGEHGEHV
jgi:hypothetical protein